MTANYDSDYFNVYNNILSKAGEEFSLVKRLCSPTLSKQESITRLYDSIHYNDKNNGNVLFDVLRFPLLFAYKLFFYLIVSIVARNNSDITGKIILRTWLEPRCSIGLSAVDVHFASLAEDCAKFSNTYSMFSIYKLSFLKSFLLKRRSDQILHEGFLTVSSILKIFIGYFKNSYIQVKNDYKFKGVSITSNINKSLFSDFIKLRSLPALVEAEIFKKIRKYNPRAIIYVYENQSWERMLCYTMHGSGVRLIGMQGSGFSPVFLNFFPTKADSQLPAWPDIIYTVGDNFTRSLLDNGFYNIPVKTFGALRFPYPHDGTKYRVQSPVSEIYNRVLYALPVHIDQYSEIIYQLASVFAGTNIIVDLKFHPHYLINDLRNKFKIPANFNWVDCLAEDELKFTYDLVLFNDNSFGIESLFCGVKCFEFDIKLPVTDQRLIYFDIWNPRVSCSELTVLAQAIRDKTLNKLYDQRRVEEYINNMYKPYSNQYLLINNYLESANREPN